MNSLIGITENIYLPEVGQTSFAAKIDTGADTSSIWASSIEQVDDTLRYTLFAPGSAYYTGKFFETNHFKITSVKSSFGHKELRYKIRLKVKIDNTVYNSWFTLADRSKNSYSILIGKNFLKNRFVVDVSRKYIKSSADSVQKILVITSKPDEMMTFLNSVKTHNKQSVQYHTVRFEELLFDINGSSTTVINTADNNKDLASYYSLVYFKSHWKYPELAATLAEYLMYRSRPFFDSELKSYTSRSKISEYMKLTTHGIDIPRSFAGYPELILKQSKKIIKELGFPFILKSASSDRGKDNFFIADQAVFEEIINKVSSTDIYIAQAFIPSDGFYRINVFHKNATIAVYRSSCPHKDPLKNHLNKPSGGINASKLLIKSLPPVLTQLAVKASLFMQRDIAGVDIIQDKLNEKYYILEVNSSPQLRSGPYLDKKAVEFAKFIDKELKR